MKWNIDLGAIAPNPPIPAPIPAVPPAAATDPLASLEKFLSLTETAFSDLRPLFKVQELPDGRHTISGLVTAEVVDKDGEICDYLSTKPQYEAWEAEALHATKAAGIEESRGNCRLQHTMEIAGKITKLHYYDDKKEIWADTEPVSEKILTMALRGFIKGFSQGGKYLWRKCNSCMNPLEKGSKCDVCGSKVLARYAAKPSELSYVDSPCLANAIFSVVKLDGSVELRKFVDPEKNEGKAYRVVVPAVKDEAEKADLTAESEEPRDKKKVCPHCGKPLFAVDAIKCGECGKAEKLEAVGLRKALEAVSDKLIKDFDPNQPRDPAGKWTSGGAAGAQADRASHAAIQASDKAREDKGKAAHESARDLHEQASKEHMHAAASAHESGDEAGAKFHARIAREHAHAAGNHKRVAEHGYLYSAARGAAVGAGVGAAAAGALAIATGGEGIVAAPSLVGAGANFGAAAGLGRRGAAGYNRPERRIKARYERDHQAQGVGAAKSVGPILGYDDDDLVKFDPNQPRDEHGQWAATQAAHASTKSARESSKLAFLKPSALGHQAAMTAHQTSAQLHLEAADRHLAHAKANPNDTKSKEMAQRHEVRAEEHQAAAEAHYPESVKGQRAQIARSAFNVGVATLKYGAPIAGIAYAAWRNSESGQKARGEAHRFTSNVAEVVQETKEERARTKREGKSGKWSHKERVQTGAKPFAPTGLDAKLSSKQYAQTQRKAIGAMLEFQKAINLRDLNKYSPDQLRDDSGKWTASQATNRSFSASDKAFQSSGDAVSEMREETVTRAQKHHEEAAQAHKDAAQAWRDAPVSKEKGLKGIIARMKAKRHDRTAKIHEETARANKKSLIALKAHEKFIASGSQEDRASAQEAHMMAAGAHSRVLISGMEDAHREQVQGLDTSDVKAKRAMRQMVHGALKIAAPIAIAYGAKRAYPKVAEWAARHHDAQGKGPKAQRAGKPKPSSGVYNSNQGGVRMLTASDAPGDLSKYAPTQARDDRGRWTNEAAASTIAEIRTKRAAGAAETSTRKAASLASARAAVEQHEKAASAHERAQELHTLAGNAPEAAHHEDMVTYHRAHQQAFQSTAEAIDASERVQTGEDRKVGEAQTAANHAAAAKLHAEAAKFHREIGNDLMAAVHESAAEDHAKGKRKKLIEWSGNKAKGVAIATGAAGGFKLVGTAATKEKVKEYTDKFKERMGWGKKKSPDAAAPSASTPGAAPTDAKAAPSTAGSAGSAEAGSSKEDKPKVRKPRPPKPLIVPGRVKLRLKAGPETDYSIPSKYRNTARVLLNQAKERVQERINASPDRSIALALRPTPGIKSSKPRRKAG